MPDRPTRILDPRTAPVERVDVHLPAVDAQQLTEAALRHRFSRQPMAAPELPGDGVRFRAGPASAAAVLVALILREHGLNVLLTRRTDHLREHAGQISFPGGRTEPSDGGAAATALREAQEEVGLDAGCVEVIGCLPDYTTVTNFVVTPVVALVRPDVQLTLDPFEVAEAFEVPLHFLMNPAHHRWHRIELAGEARLFLSMPWSTTDTAGAAREYFIWGATAAMLRNLYAALVV